MSIATHLLLENLTAKADKTLLDSFEIKRLLVTSGILEFLRARYQPSTLDSLDYYRGANDLLDELLYFKEAYFQDKSVQVPEARFNSLNLALASGEMTKEEANALRAGKSPDYSKYTNPPKSNKP